MAKKKHAPTAGIHRLWPEFPMIYQMGRVKCRHAQIGGLSSHFNQGIEICYIRKGTFRWQAEGRVFQLDPGDGYVTLPWQLHGGEGDVRHRGLLDYVVIGLDRCEPKGRWKWGDWAAVDETTNRFVADTLRSNLNARVAGGQRIGELFDKLWAELSGPRPGRGPLVHAALVEMIIEVARRVKARVTPSDMDGRVAAALNTVAMGLDQSWSLEEMAGLAGLGRTRFSDLVKKRTGVTPMKYLEQRRIERAQSLLLMTNRPVTRIAMDLGFSSSQYFAQAFARECGLSPKAYREKKR